MSKSATELTNSALLENNGRSLINLIEAGNYSMISVLCDRNTERDCWPLLQKMLNPTSIKTKLITVPAGEQHKQLDSAQMIWKGLSEIGADRYSLLINLGGGMITDLGGFSASLYKRGIDFIHLPTSLLAMVDAAIGGKTGVDLDGLKNQIGLFKQPTATLIFPAFLRTLAKAELKSGMAEWLKQALIADAELWRQSPDALDQIIDAELIMRAASIKEQIVSRDPEEKGERKLLNFGHSIGHALETFFLNHNRQVPHGFAIAAGMICESYLSYRSELLPKEAFMEISRLLKNHFPHLIFEEKDHDEILNYLKQDKKNRDGKLLFVLLRQIGKASYDHEIKTELVLDALKYYQHGS